MAEPKDRYRALLASTSHNGIDFVTVDPADARILYVHFLNAVPFRSDGIGATITGGDSIPKVLVERIEWGADAEGRPLLTLRVRNAGDFSNYLLTLVDAPALDLMYASSRFSFKANCPSDFDCAPPPQTCPPDDTPVPPIDYLAKDFQSFVRALTDFSALRYPEWQERSEADFGMMFMEALSAVADELSFLQDRVSAEATLETATQRGSLVNLARLVDYEPTPATSGTTQLQLDVPAAATLSPGARIFATAPDGRQVPFEIGTGLADQRTYPVNNRRNYGIINPYWFDDDQRCCPQGATDLWVEGHGHGFRVEEALLIQTDLPDRNIRQIVHLTARPVETFDPLFPPGGPPTPVTHLFWGSNEALTEARDLTHTKLGGNIVPATQGSRVTETFAVGTPPASAPNAVLTVARRGPNSSDDEPNWVYRYGLRQAPLGWLAGSDPTAAPLPEVQLNRRLPAAEPWLFIPHLIDAEATEYKFTIDPIAWRAVARSPTGQPTQYEYDGDGGSSLRFGNGVFGAAPAEEDVFDVTYRTGLGATGNVAADTITLIDPAFAATISSARNPFPVTDGADAETAQHILRMAPQAFRAVQYRAVRPEDYAAAAETLPWVQKAVTSFRWTGSWLTVFTAADPRGSEVIAAKQHLELVELLDRYRLAGYESYAPPPDYLSIDLRIEVCVESGWLDGDVEAGVLDRLGSATRPNDAAGFFFADRFTFGTPLYRSRLEAAIQVVAGVAGVLSITYRQRGTFAGFVALPQVVAPGPTQILRCDNDPSWPERGTIRVIAEGGR
jgi:hypothetical protein